ncbi:CYTH domain-containing protein [Patescibacteria group bacterium]|nr:CYTH domain-containing protein [Patescibacteria group bacterium]
MIEVEKKFLLDEAAKKRLIEGAEFISKKEIHDEYFDDENYSLTTNDIWLRCRDGRFELKDPLQNQKSDNRFFNRYEELESNDEICARLNIPSSDSMREDLEKAGYKPFSKYVTTRTKYKKDGFTIDLDITDFDYGVNEIELLVEREDEMDEAIKRIKDFAKKHQLTLQSIRGKLPEYLKRNNPDHHQALVDAEII